MITENRAKYHVNLNVSCYMHICLPAEQALIRLGKCRLVRILHKICPTSQRRTSLLVVEEAKGIACVYGMGTIFINIRLNNYKTMIFNRQSRKSLNSKN